ncbi:MAG TPA: ATP-grasp domain-containing protein [Thermotoga sp.]|nr:ATP-grasp domain-containing protein [Thermotoga sp.]
MRIGIACDKNLDEKKEKMVAAVAEAITRLYDVVVIPFDENFMRKVKEVDFVFNLSTAGGKDVRQLHVPAILDLLKVPYSSSSAFVHALCLDKKVTKIILTHYNLPTPKFFVVDVGESLPDNLNLNYPVIVKPVKEGSSAGLRKESVVYEPSRLEEAVRYIHEVFEEPALVEEFIDGTEVSLGIIGNDENLEVLPLLEVDFSNLPEGVEKFYSHRVKHELDEYLRYHCPARLPEKVEKGLKETGKKVFKILGLRDYARMDIRIRGDEYFFLEINSLPLLVPVFSDIIKMAEAAGYSYEDFILKLLRIAMQRYGMVEEEM